MPQLTDIINGDNVILKCNRLFESSSVTNMQTKNLKNTAMHSTFEPKLCIHIINIIFVKHFTKNKG